MPEIRQIRIRGHKIGLVGLDEAFAEARLREFDSDEDLAGTLLDLVAGKNYVPETGRKDYAMALLREFRAAKGESAEAAGGASMGHGEGAAGGGAARAVIEVRVYGPGCANCERLASETISAPAALGIDAGFEHVRDLNEIAAVGPVGMPALAINGIVVVAGRVPARAKIMELLREATE